VTTAGAQGRDRGGEGGAELAAAHGQLLAGESSSMLSLRGGGAGEQQSYAAMPRPTSRGDPGMAALCVTHAACDRCSLSDVTRCRAVVLAATPARLVRTLPLPLPPFLPLTAWRSMPSWLSRLSRPRVRAPPSLLLARLTSRLAGIPCAARHHLPPPPSPPPPL
jgi:hypothetical protein